MADMGKPQPEGLDKAKLKQYLVPAMAVAAVVALAGLVIFVSGGTGRKMSDGSNGSTDDSDLKEVTPGVKARDIKEGMGDPCPPGSSVTMHYTGWKENGEVFDGTREGSKATGAPRTFKLSELIKGWQEGIPGMMKGGIRKLVISPEKGYGTTGKGPLVGQTLIFEVELVGFTPPPPDARPRRPIPEADITRLSDGTTPGADDPNLIPIGTSGLKYRDIKVGDGAVCPEGAHVVMDYAGWLTSGGTPFDTSWKAQGEPLDMSLRRLVPGWQQGVPGMRVGGVRKLVIPPALGYGEGGQGTIPPNATLVFEIELLGLR